jgi:hypothetical protein
VAKAEAKAVSVNAMLETAPWRRRGNEGPAVAVATSTVAADAHHAPSAEAGG